METENLDAKPERETSKTEKQGGESQQGPAAPLPVEEPPHSEAKVQDTDKGRDETDGEEDKVFNKLADAEAEQTKWERMQGEWTRIGAVTTAALGLATFLLLFHQTCTLSKQLESMQSSSNDTQKMIVAMQQQANASQNTADRQGDIVEQMGRQADASVNAANAATTQAAASQTQANASISQAEATRIAAQAAQDTAQISIQGTRPYLVITTHLAPTPGHETAMNLTFKNDGNSTATVRVRYAMRFTGEFSYESGGRFTPFTVSPRAFEERRIPVPVSYEQVQAMSANHKTRLTFSLKGVYQGVGTWPVDICREWGQGVGDNISFFELSLPCEEGKRQ